MSAVKVLLRAAGFVVGLAMLVAFFPLILLACCISALGAAVVDEGRRLVQPQGIRLGEESEPGSVDDPNLAVCKQLWELDPARDPFRPGPVSRRWPPVIPGRKDGGR